MAFGGVETAARRLEGVRLLALVALHRIDIITLVGVVEPNVHRMGSIVRLLASTRSSSQLRARQGIGSRMSLGSTASATVLP